MSNESDKLRPQVTREESAPKLDHVTVENENAPDECAIFPREATEEELASSWIAAPGSAFVDLDSMR